MKVINKKLLFLVVILVIVMVFAANAAIEDENHSDVKLDTYETNAVESELPAIAVVKSIPRLQRYAPPELTTSEQVSPEQASPEQASPEQASPEQASPEQAVPEQAHNVNSGSIAWQILELVNAERATHGLHALVWDDSFARSAQNRAGEITTYFSGDHRRPDGREWNTALYDIGIIYRSAGENIANGGHSTDGAAWYTPSMVMNAWMNSPSHRNNILNGGFEVLGVGVIDVGYTRYYVQHFGAY